MSEATARAPRITVEGDAIEVAGRFTSEAEIAAFIARLWDVFFAVHPDEEPESQSTPAPPHVSAVRVGLDPAIHESGPPCHGVDARDKRGHDDSPEPTQREAHLKDDPSADDVSSDAAAFARCTPSERRAVLLKRKHDDIKVVARTMEVNPNTVYLYLRNAREKGVAI